jgi:tRNA(Ile)-lysidine synthetase-like protein
LVVLPASWLQDPGDLEWCIPGPGIWPLEALDARLQVDGRLERAWFPLQVRNWRPGDRIATPAARHRKLQDVFVDRRVERPLRRRFPLLVLDPAQTGRQVFWIGGPQVGGSGLGAPSTPVLRQTLQVNFAPNASSGLLLELLNAPKAVSSA